MPKLTRDAIDREINRVISNIPADEVEMVDTKERQRMIFQAAYDLAWNDVSNLTLGPRLGLDAQDSHSKFNQSA